MDCKAGILYCFLCLFAATTFAESSSCLINIEEERESILKSFEIPMTTDAKFKSELYKFLERGESRKGQSFNLHCDGNELIINYGDCSFSIYQSGYDYESRFICGEPDEH